jgi:hypothetical protein
MNRTGPPRSPAVLQRFSALFVALLWCAAPVLALVHGSAEAHRYCAEHGRLEDAGDGGSGEDGAARRQIVDAQGTASHDDCAFSQTCRFGQTLIAFLLEACGTLEAPPLVQPQRDPAPPPIALISFAPKTSPPV